MRTTLAMMKNRNQAKRGVIFKFTAEMFGYVVGSHHIFRSEEATEWVMKSICLADIGGLSYWDDVECEIFQKPETDIVCVKLTTLNRLVPRMYDIAEGMEYPQKTLGDEW